MSALARFSDRFMCMTLSISSSESYRWPLIVSGCCDVNGHDGVLDGRNPCASDFDVEVLRRGIGKHALMAGVFEVYTDGAFGSLFPEDELTYFECAAFLAVDSHVSVFGYVDYYDGVILDWHRGWP